MTAVWLAFFVGLSGFVHCLGMCGPFALHWAGGGRSLLPQLLWHAARITSYAFLGCLAGFAGSRILVLPHANVIGQVLSYLAALIMLLSALRLLGWMPVRHGHAGRVSLLAPILQGMLHEKSLAGPVATGILCGFLPCPMTMAFLVLAVSSSSVALGGAIMAALGAGTLVPLLLLGLSGKLLLPRLGRLARPAGAIILVVLAGTTILRPMDVGRCPACETAKPAAISTTQEGNPSTCPCHAANTAACP